MEKYKCKICNKQHSILNTSISPVPKELSDAQKKQGRVEKLGENTFVVDNLNMFISGDIEIEIADLAYDISHRVWVKFPLKIFNKKYETLKSGKPISIECVILSEAPFFEKSEGLKAVLHLHKDIYGEVRVSSESQIKIDQSKPISKERVIEMCQRIYHPEIWQPKEIFTQPFSARLESIIAKAIEEYQSVGKNFVINVSNLFQITHSSLIENSTIEGYGIHIPNDASNDDYLSVKRRMTSLIKKLNLQEHTIEGIETYQKLFKNTEELNKDVQVIIKKVYDQNHEEIALDLFEV